LCHWLAAQPERNGGKYERRKRNMNGGKVSGGKNELRERWERMSDLTVKKVGG
jgi:hypothetical protein